MSILYLPLGLELKDGQGSACYKWAWEKFSTIYWVRTKDHNQGLPYLYTLFLICSNNKFNGKDIDSNKCLTRF